MAANESHLSGDRYGYDFVVSTTQASINAGLTEYLDTINQPPVCRFFVYQDNTPYTLDEIKSMAGIDADPFDIPDETSIDDSQTVQKLRNIRFVAGFLVKIGLPPGIDVSGLQIVNLGTSVENVLFTFYAEEFKVVYLDGYDNDILYNKLQSSDNPWTFNTKVKLKYVDLDLDSSPYFQRYPDKKRRIEERLGNVSATFSLQQLYFDLTNARRTTEEPSFSDQIGPNTKTALENSFIPFYKKQVSLNGEPVITVTAKFDQVDTSSLPLTFAQRQVNPYIGGSTPEHEDAATLSHLCMTNNNPFPGSSEFSWNWVELTDTRACHGVISINRNTFAEFLKNYLLPLAKPLCIEVYVDIYDVDIWGAKFKYKLTPGQNPCFNLFQIGGDNGSKVFSLNYSDSDSDYGGIDEQYRIKLETSYNCTVSFENNRIQIAQNCKAYAEVKNWPFHKEGTVVNKTITDTYTVSVDSVGNLQFKKGEPDISEDPDDISDEDWIQDFLGLSWVNDIKDYMSKQVSTNLQSITAEKIQDFVFPAAEVFTYKDVKFSEYQDLTTGITYLRPEVCRYLR